MTYRSTSHRGSTGALIGLIISLTPLILHGPATAQTLFRCGNAYQDRPCSGGQESKVIGKVTSSPEPDTGSADASCAQRGGAALKIVWRREGGATLEQALSDVRSAPQRELIEEVYRARGTAAQVRTRIEADCMAEKERKARYAAMMDATRGGSPAIDGRPLGDREPVQPATVAGEFPPRAKADADASKKKDTCDFLVSKLDAIRMDQRAGGSIARMDRLKRDLERTDQEMRKAGCS